MDPIFLLILVFMLVAVLYLSAATGWLVMSGAWQWTEDVRRDTFRLWGLGMGLAVIGSLVFLGIGGLLSAWPVWLLFIAIFVGGTAAQDAWHGIGWFKRQPTTRTITHRDGRRASINRRYRPLD